MASEIVAIVRAIQVWTWILFLTTGWVIAFHSAEWEFRSLAILGVSALILAVVTLHAIRRAIRASRLPSRVGFPKNWGVLVGLVLLCRTAGLLTGTLELVLGAPWVLVTLTLMIMGSLDPAFEPYWCADLRAK